MGQPVTLVIPGPSGQDIKVGQTTANGVAGFPVSVAPSSASTVKTINDTASSVTLVAPNANRTGMVITNTSSAVLYVRMAAGTASEIMFTYRLPQNETQEILFPYTGVVTGMWATDNNDGVAVITEFTA